MARCRIEARALSRWAEPSRHRFQIFEGSATICFLGALIGFHTAPARRSPQSPSQSVSDFVRDMRSRRILQLGRWPVFFDLKTIIIIVSVKFQAVSCSSSLLGWGGCRKHSTRIDATDDPSSTATCLMPSEFREPFCALPA